MTASTPPTGSSAELPKKKLHISDVWTDLLNELKNKDERCTIQGTGGWYIESADVFAIEDLYVVVDHYMMQSSRRTFVALDSIAYISKC